MSQTGITDANGNRLIIDAGGGISTNLIAAAIPNAGFAASSQAGSPPSSGTSGGQTGAFSSVRTYITYAGAVTAASLRLYTRLPGGSTWFRGASTDDLDALTPASGNESRDWAVGAGVECLFVLESVSPGTAGNTVAVDVIGVSA
jgi:hypothetical protein